MSVKTTGAEIEQMERQVPICRAEDLKHAESLLPTLGLKPENPLYALPGAQNVPKAVAYLDLGTGGYMDIGTDLTDEALAALPKGRHMLGIVGTYGVEGYVQAQPAPSVPDGFAWPECPNRRQSHVLFDDGYEEGWAACVATIKAALAAPEAKP